MLSLFYRSITVAFSFERKSKPTEKTPRLANYFLTLFLPPDPEGI